MGINEDAMWAMARKMGMPESAIEAVKAKKAAAKEGKSSPMPDLGKIMEMMKGKNKDEMMNMAKKMGMPPLAKGMDGNEVIRRLKKLNTITELKDIPVLSHALFPGTHCPLMGAEMAIAGINDCLMVIVGTDECSYYTKGMTINERWGGLKGRCVSIILDGHDVTFGSTQMMVEAFKEIMAEYQPKCVALVTTCIIEVIGDDYDAIAAQLTKEYGIPVMAIHTEHFKCEDHFPGLERTISACYELMEAEVEKQNTVNVLGQRMGDFCSTELYAMLTKADVKVAMQLPSGTSVEEIRQAAAAKVNIVVHDIALPLAKQMQESFGIPYVYFNRFVNPEHILTNYKELFSYLGADLPKEVMDKYAACKALEEQVKPVVKDITYVYGNTPFDCFEYNSYLCQLGMKAVLIQSNRFAEVNQADVQNILKYANPYICRAANIPPLRSVYDVIHPHMYMGHEFDDILRKKGMANLHTDRAGTMMGFEVNQFLLELLPGTVAKAKEYRKEAGL